MPAPRRVSCSHDPWPCHVCGREIKLGSGVEVEFDIDGYIIPEGHVNSGTKLSMGYFAVGSECKKKLKAIAVSTLRNRTEDGNAEDRT